MKQKLNYMVRIDGIRNLNRATKEINKATKALEKLIARSEKATAAFERMKAALPCLMEIETENENE